MGNATARWVQADLEEQPGHRVVDHPVPPRWVHAAAERPREPARPASEEDVEDSGRSWLIPSFDLPKVDDPWQSRGH